jgi:hypothetical protein
MKMVQKYSVFVAIFLTACFITFIVPACQAASGDTLTRGSRFTITITGLPNTPYYVWVASTSGLSGTAGDQPPVIAGGQSNIQMDPPGGPYTIGNYAFQNGNGKTIREDVAPSTPDTPNTNYYALVTTDGDGRAVVAFQTSFSTATRTFSIKVENPGTVANTNVAVELGVPVKITTVPTTTRATPTVSPSPTTAPVTYTVTTPFPVTTTITVTTTPGPAVTPSRASFPGIEVIFLAVIAGLVLTTQRRL